MSLNIAAGYIMAFFQSSREYFGRNLYLNLRKRRTSTSEYDEHQPHTTNETTRQPHGTQTPCSFNREINTNPDPRSDYRNSMRKPTLRQKGYPVAPQHNYQDHRSDSRRYEHERATIIKDLEAKLWRAEKDSSYYLEHSDKTRKELDEVCRELDKAQTILDESRRKERVYYENQKAWMQQQNELTTKYNSALAHISSLELNINELTVEISRSVNTNGTTTRGDDYFETKFASLEGAIRQWVYRSFRGISGVKHRDLLPTLQNSLNKAVIGNSHMSKDSKVSRREMEATVSERLHAHIFHPTLVLTIQGQFYDIEHISEVLGGTNLEKREWRARTVGMILRDDHHRDHLNQNIRFVEKDFEDCFNFLLKRDNEQQHFKSFLAIIEQAAKLQVEIFQQVAHFELYKIEPGAHYDPHIMDDISSLADNDEVEAQTFIVRIVIFPAVLRFGFDENGKFSTGPVIIRKGTVVTMYSEEE